MIKKILTTAAILSSPLLVSAVTAPLEKINNANDLVKRLSSFGTVAIGLLITLALVYIVWNIVQYFIGSKAGESRKESGKNIGYGIVGLAVILSIWGLVNILVNTFNTSSDAPTDKFPKADFINANTAPANPIIPSSGSGS